MPYLKCNDINLHYEVSGCGDPLCIISGLGEDVRSLIPLVRRLKNEFTVIEFDQRGAGKSDKPKDPYTISQMANDTLCLLGELGFSKAHVVGFSMGGCVALELALNHREIIETLTLISTLPSWIGPYPIKDEIIGIMMQTDISEGLLKDVYEKFFGPRFKKRVPFEEYLRERMIDPEPQPAFAYLNQLTAIQSFDVRSLVDNIDSTTFIIAGDSDEVVPINNSLWLHEHIKNSKLNILDGCGHNIIIEAPEEIADLIIKNLKS